jgi:2-hydroxyglutarate dehydrogenase
MQADLIVVGAGIVGLAVARELAHRHPGRQVVVLERAPAVGQGQTARNSGVAHAGIYYAPGSLKARLCVAGMRELREYCVARGLEFVRAGKLIVALDAGELPRLDELERRGAANGVPGLRRLDAEQLRTVEPHAAGIAALHSPETGVLDFGVVARAFADDVRAAGGAVRCGAEVTSVQVGAREVRLGVGAGEEITGAAAVFCAGAASDRLAELAGAGPDPRIVPFRGAYLRLRPERRELVRGLIYPVPDPALPFLGVHLTRHHDGEVFIGPTALLALGRRTASRVLRWPGTWHMARRWWRTGLTEVHHALAPAALVRAAARYVPELEPGDAAPAWAGVRAQAVARDGRLVDDFVFARTGRALHVRNAPSPAATASLAIARHVADEADREFAL